MNPEITKLKPCPFCGEEVGIEQAGNDTYEINCCASMWSNIGATLSILNLEEDPEYQPEAASPTIYPPAAHRAAQTLLANDWNLRMS